MVPKNWAGIKRVAVKAVAAGVAFLLVAEAVQWRDSELSRLRADFSAKVREANITSATHMDSLLEQLFKDLRRISRLPDVRNISADGRSLQGVGRRTVQELYNDLASTLNVSEIYIVPKDIDPDSHSGPQEPTTTFDELIVGRTAAKAEHSKHEEVEEIEVFEYREMKRQCALLAQVYGTKAVVETLDVPFVSSKEVVTCDNRFYDPAAPNDLARSGAVYSVPFFDDDGHFKGVISAVILTSELAQALGNDSDVLVNTGTGYRVSRSPDQGKSPQLVEAREASLKLSDVAGPWKLTSSLPLSQLEEGQAMKTMTWLFGARIVVAALSGATILLLALLEAAWRRRQKALEAELKKKVEEQTSELSQLVQQLENANVEQAAQAQELADYADELQARQEDLERALNDSEMQTSLYAHASKRFESLFNGLPVGCATFSTEREVMEWNTTMSSIARCAPYEALLRPVEQVFVGLCESDLENALTNALQAGVATSFESEWVREGQDQMFVHVSVFPMRHKSGEIVGGIMCVFDTTVAAQASRAVALSEAKLRAFIDHAPAAVAIFDNDLNYLAASRRWYSDYNLDDLDIIGRSHYEVFPEIPDEWREIHRRALKGEAIQCPEERFDRADGDHIWIQWEVRPWYDQAGEIGGLAMMTEDISERKAVMEQLYEAHEQVSSILESINDAFLSIDNDGVVVYINQAASQVLGVQKLDAEDKPLEVVCPRQLYTPVSVLCEQARLTATKQNLEFEFEGTWLDFRVYPSGDGHSIFFQDITDRKKIQMQVDSLLVQMNEVNIKLEVKQCELETANAYLRDLATTDGLTGIHNHRFFQEFLAEHLATSLAEGTPLGVILMDVDKFKSFNDDFGHQEGDAVLKGVAQALKAVVKDPHLVARYGGEEFVVVTVGLDVQETWELAESIRLEIEAQEWPKRSVTASFGVSMAEPDCKPRELIERADKALYRSKQGGRNRTTVFDEGQAAA